MGHTHASQKNAARLGFSDNNDAKDPEDEVNDYLMRAIDARSIDRLRSEHCKSVLLTFKKSSIEQKVGKRSRNKDKWPQSTGGMMSNLSCSTSPSRTECCSCTSTAV